MSEVIRDIIRLPTGRLSAKQIIAAVATRHNMTVDEMIAPRRFKNLVHARQEAMWELSNRTRLSLNQIGERLGLSDHVTILHGIRRHAERLAKAQGEAA